MQKRRDKNLGGSIIAGLCHKDNIVSVFWIGGTRDLIFILGSRKITRVGGFQCLLQKTFKLQPLYIGFANPEL